jgi:drug/metabolite transporter (DMT)-like permease
MRSIDAIAPPAPSRQRTWLNPLELGLLGAIWGASFLFMRIGAADFGPFALVEIRLGLGAIILFPFLWRERARFTTPLRWRLAAIGAINSAIPFVLFAWGAERAPAGVGAICNALTVMFTVLVGVAFYGERISVRQSIGMLAGFAGVVVLASGKTSGGGVWLAALAGTAASLCYGFGVNLIRRHLAGIPAGAVAAATLLGASLLTAPLAIWTWPQQPVPVRSWIAAALLGILCTGIAFVLYYRLINRIGGPRASMVTYLVPLFAVLWAWLALAEPLTASMAVSAALILGGVALSQQPRPAVVTRA